MATKTTAKKETKKTTATKKAATTKKVAAKKTTTTKKAALAKKTPAKKETTKKVAAKKTPAKKTTTKKTAAQKKASTKKVVNKVVDKVVDKAIDLQEEAEKLIAKLTNEPGLIQDFLNDPIKFVEDKTGLDLPDEQINKIIDQVKEAVNNLLAKVDTKKAKSLFDKMVSFFK